MAFPKKEIVTVAVTGAAGQIGYALCPLIARGLMLGAEQKVELRLLDLPQAQQVMDGVAMELQDCNFATLAGCVATSDPVVAFTGCDVAVMCGAFPRKQGMDRKDLLKINADIFTKHGETLKAVGAPHCRVLVVGNPANTNALLLATASSGVLDPRNVTALTRLDHNRATAMAALKAGGPVRNVVIWGNHSGTQVPDVDHATCAAGTVRAAAKADEYFDGAFIPAVQQRGAEVIKMRGLSSAASAASAIVDHVRDWICGTAEGEYVSMAVTSNGNPYGIPEGLVFSFPVTCKDGEWTIVGGLDHTDKVKEMLRETVAELQTERTHALGE